MNELSGIKYLERRPSAHSIDHSLMLLIHGYGSNENDLFSFADQLPSKYHIVSLRGIRKAPFQGFSWYDIHHLTPTEKHSNFKQAIHAQDSIKNFINAFIEKEQLTEKKITLCGFSQGCVLSYSLALQYPELIKNVVALSGYPAFEILPHTLVKEVSNLNFFISHGVQDSVIPVEHARKIKPLMEQWNISYTYKEYPAGHGMNTNNFQDMIQWIENHS